MAVCSCIRVSTALFIFLTTAGVAAAQVCKAPEAVTEFGVWSSPNIELNEHKQSLPLTVSGEGRKIAAVRLLFRILSKESDSQGWSVVIRDPKYRPIVTLTDGDFRDEQGSLGGARWTGRLPDSKFRIELNSVGALGKLRILVTDAIALPADTPEDVHLFSVQKDGNPQWSDLFSDNIDVEAKRAGDSVAMIYSGKEVVSTGSRRSWCCSAVLIAPALLLTNWHCGGVPNSGQYWDDVTCGNTLIDFSWDGGKISRQFSCVHVEAKDLALDYAVLRIKPVLGSGSGRVEGVNLPRLRDMPIKNGDGLQIIHHAKCGFKLISANCNVASVNYKSWISSGPNGSPGTTEFTHTCDTEPGASGAPVFDVKGMLVALHHLGFDRDANCTPLDRVNKAVELRHILAHLKENHLKVFDEIKPFISQH